jgi:PPK2 family polyphosphate:nucleotide phosphotransferase
MNWKKCKLKPKKKIKLREIDTCCHPEKDKKETVSKLEEDIKEIAKLQYKLYAENRRSLLIILQGMDASGKDSAIRHIMSGINPQGVQVHSFKHPSEAELEHDYFWRHIQKLPERGQITIFNRSYYENALISKVHPQNILAEHLPGIDNLNKIGKKFWENRYKQINNFEKNCVQNGMQILKFFLHLSKHEQRDRFLERIENKEKHWKFSSDDISERNYWKEYQDAYELVLKHTGTKAIPWYIIPADDKLVAHLFIGRIILEQLKKMNPAFPPITGKEKVLMEKAKARLRKE